MSNVSEVCEMWFSMEKVKAIASISPQTHTHTQTRRNCASCERRSTCNLKSQSFSQHTAAIWCRHRGERKNVNEIIFGFENLQNSSSVSLTLSAVSRTLLLFRHWKLSYFSYMKMLLCFCWARPTHQAELCRRASNIELESECQRWKCCKAQNWKHPTSSLRA